MYLPGGCSDLREAKVSVISFLDTVADFPSGGVRTGRNVYTDPIVSHTLVFSPVHHLTVIE